MVTKPMADSSAFDDEGITPFVLPEESEGEGTASPEPKFEPAKAPVAPQASGAVQPMQAGPAEPKAAEPTAAQPDGKHKFHDQMRSFDTATTTNRGMMLALDASDPDYLKKLAGLQTREGLIKTEKANYEAQHPLGSPESAHPGFGGKLMHVLGNVGNIAGTALVPGLMPSIPGSRMNIIGQRMQGEEEMQEAGKANLQASEAAAHTASATGGNKASWEALHGPDGKPVSHNGMPVLVDKNTAKLAVMTPQGAVPIGGAQKAQVPGSQGFFDPAQVDENKQPVKEEGAAQHMKALQTLESGMSANDKADFEAAYGVTAKDTHAIQEKRLADAKSSAQLSSSERDRALQRDIAARNHQDAMVNHADQVRISGQKNMFDYGVNPANKEKLTIDNAPDEMLVNSKTGQPIPFKMLSTLKPSQMESNRADFARSAIHSLDKIDEILKAGEVKYGQGFATGPLDKIMAKVGLGQEYQQELLNYLTFAQSAATGAHVGGRFNVPIMDKMGTTVTVGMNLNQLRGAIDSIKDVMQQYTDQGGRLTVQQYKELPDKERKRLQGQGQGAESGEVIYDEKGTPHRYKGTGSRKDPNNYEEVKP